MTTKLLNIKDHDNGITNFHFEIAADILNEEELSLLNTLRPGAVQMEIGVQSTNRKTIEEINRTMDVDKLAAIVARIHQGKNIHIHLDLIAGLPYEDYSSFQNSFKASVPETANRSKQSLSCHCQRCNSSC